MMHYDHKWWAVLGLDYFFFKQKTAYEMRISDWSSDVCSSDLGKRTDQHAGASGRHAAERSGEARRHRIRPHHRGGADHHAGLDGAPVGRPRADRKSVV